MHDKTWILPDFLLHFDSLWSFPTPIDDKERKTLIERAASGFKARVTSKDIGFYSWPKDIAKENIERIEALSRELRKNTDGAVMIGIGGSHLGPAAFLQALRSPEEEQEYPIFWLSNVDPAAIRQAKAFVKARNVSSVVISKSGSTMETLSGFFHLSDKLSPKHLVVITDPDKGMLREKARQHGWKALEVPPNIGGRYSALTAVGLLPAALGNIAIDEIIEGAAQIREQLESLPAEENPALLLALAKYLWDTKFDVSVHYLMPYWSNLRMLADWYVQLWAESLGKHPAGDPDDCVGPTPVAALGSTDQHSLLQLFKQGPKNKLVGFIDVIAGDNTLPIGKPGFELSQFSHLTEHSFDELSHFACRSTQESLNRSQVPTYRLELPKITPKAMGAMMLFFEASCTYAAELYGVNAFDQPGVEEAKKILREKLS